MSTYAQHTRPKAGDERLTRSTPCHDWSDARLAWAAQKGPTRRKRQALSVLVERHTDLVQKVASMFRSYMLPQEDLLAEGYIGLMRAAEKYRPEKGAGFRTYAVFWIRRAMRRAVDNHGSIVRIPPDSGDRFRKLRAAQGVFRDRLGREATLGELAATMGISEDVVRNLHAVDVRVVSMHTPVDCDGGLCVGDMLPDTHGLDPVSVLMRREHLELLHRSVSELDHRGSEVIQRRFGLGQEEPETLEGIGRKIGVTKECVRKVQQRSIRRLHDLLAPHAEDLQSHPESSCPGAFLGGLQAVPA